MSVESMALDAALAETTPELRAGVAIDATKRAEAAHARSRTNALTPRQALQAIDVELYVVMQYVNALESGFESFDENRARYQLALRRISYIRTEALR